MIKKGYGLGICTGLIFWLGISLSFGAESQFNPEANRRLKLNLESTFEGESLDGKIISSQIAGLRLIAFGQQNWSQEFSLDFGIGALVETGSTETVYAKYYSPQNRFLLDHAHFNYQPLENVSLKAGILNARSVSPLNLSDSPYIGVGEEFHFNISNIRFQWSLMQANTPDPSTLSDTNLPGEGAAFHFGQSLQIEDGFFNLHHFYFSELNQKHAERGLIAGNTVQAAGSGQARLANQFHGFAVTHQSVLPLSTKLNPLLKASYIHNLEVQGQDAYGIELGGGLKWKLSTRDELSGDFSIFRNGSDFYPAGLLKNSYGWINSKGWMAGLGFQKVGGFSIRAQYLQSDALKSSLLHDRFYSAELQLQSLLEIL